MSVGIVSRQNSLKKVSEWAHHLTDFVLEESRDLLSTLALKAIRSDLEKHIVLSYYNGMSKMLHDTVAQVVMNCDDGFIRAESTALDLVHASFRQTIFDYENGWKDPRAVVLRASQEIENAKREEDLQEAKEACESN